MTSHHHARSVQIKNRTASERQPPTRCIHLSREQGASLLCELNHMLDDGCDHLAGVAELRTNLEDACWLARWKREQIELELCPSILSDALETLLRHHQLSPPSADTTALEEIIQILVSNGSEPF